MCIFNTLYDPRKTPMTPSSRPPDLMAPGGPDETVQPIRRGSTEFVTFCSWLERADKNIERYCRDVLSDETRPSNDLEKLVVKRLDFLSDLRDGGVSEEQAYAWINEMKARRKPGFEAPEPAPMHDPLAVLERRDPFDPRELADGLGGPYYGPGPYVP